MLPIHAALTLRESAAFTLRETAQLSPCRFATAELVGRALAAAPIVLPLLVPVVVRAANTAGARAERSISCGGWGACGAATTQLSPFPSSLDGASSIAAEVVVLLIVVRAANTAGARTRSGAEPGAGGRRRGGVRGVREKTAQLSPCRFATAALVGRALPAASILLPLLVPVVVRAANTAGARTPLRSRARRWGAAAAAGGGGG